MGWAPSMGRGEDQEMSEKSEQSPHVGCLDEQSPGHCQVHLESPKYLHSGLLQG